MPHTLPAAASFPALSWPTVHGGTLDLNAGSGWRVLIVYRGKHCPVCRNYLNELQSMLGDFKAEDIAVQALSADPLSRAKGEADKEGWTFPIGVDLKPDEAMQLGLYVSTPRSPEETDRPFAEPGLFVLNPAGKLQIVDISNAPFCRPSLKSLLDGLKFVIANDYPIRGTA
ncbi:MAG: redoxin domain-containing protein [Pacificimonas sp.]